MKKHQRWPFSTDGTEAHAYPPVEGMISRWLGDANCFNRRFHLIWRWLLLVGTRSLSDYLMLKRSPGPKVRGMPSSTIGLPQGSSLVDFVTEYSYPSRKIEQKFMVRRQRIHGFSHSRVRSTKIPKQQGKRPTSLPNKQTNSKTVRKETNFSSNRINLKKIQRQEATTSLQEILSFYEGTNFPPRRAHLLKKRPTSLLTALPTAVT